MGVGDGVLRGRGNAVVRMLVICVVWKCWVGDEILVMCSLKKGEG